MAAGNDDLAVLAKEVITLGTLFFDDKRRASVPQACPVVRANANVLAKVLLPVVNDILLKIARDEKLAKELAKKQKNLDRYSVVLGPRRPRQYVEPNMGMVLAKNTMIFSGPSWSRWVFYQVTNITKNGTVMVKELQKVSIPDVGFTYRGQPAPYDASDGTKVKALAYSETFDVCTEETRFFDKTS